MTNIDHNTRPKHNNRRDERLEVAFAQACVTSTRLPDINASSVG